MERTLSNRAVSQPLDKTWYQDTHGKFTYGDQRRRKAALDSWCRDKGVGKGDLVLVAVHQEREQASLLCALICLGIPPVILNPEAPAGEIAPLLDRVNCRAVIAESELTDAWQLEGLGVPILKVSAAQPKGTIFNRLLKSRQQSAEPAESWPIIAENHEMAPAKEFGSGDLAYLIFTSGTTSLPKGVRISHRALCSQMDVLIGRYGLKEEDRLLNALPFNHADGLVQGPLLAWVSGATLCRPLAFSPNSVQDLMDSIYRERITHMIAVPTMLALMLRLGTDFRDNFLTPDFRVLVSAAGHLEKDLWEKLEKTLGVPVLNMYGLSETVTSALFCGPDQESYKIGTLGLPVNCDIRIVDSDGNSVADGDIGELWIASDQLMDGYHNEPDATVAILENGWLRSGDLVRRQPSGHIELVGRLKNLIISGGRNISPEEISACLNSHDAVIESVALGVEDADWGEWVAALVVAAEPVDETGLVRWCREHLSEYKVPKKVFFVQELHKGPSGKILQEQARAALLKQLASDQASEGSDDHNEVVFSLAARSFKLSLSELSGASSPENTVGWDSLAHMDLVVAIEKHFGIRLSPRDIMQIDSLQRVVDLVALKVAK
ncbi:AMP-binding protein [Porticoccus sp.]